MIKVLKINEGKLNYKINTSTGYIERFDVTDEIENMEKLKTAGIINLTPELKIIEEIRKNSPIYFKYEKKVKKITGLYDLISSPGLLRISHKKISKNDGALTPGSNNDTAEFFSDKYLQEISASLKNKTFSWYPSIKHEIPRKNKSPRPINSIDHSQKIVQNNIKMILEAIFENTFENLDTNYGFRPHKSTIDNINNISSYKNNGLINCIEGDIKGAFNNVHPPTLAKILAEIIDDKEFINIIYQACITPEKVKKNIIPRILGTPQGNIISPVLFNIYMLRFDLFVLDLINDKEFQSQNKPIPNKLYRKYTFQIEKRRNILKSYEIRKLIKKLNNQELKEIKIIKKEILDLDISRKKIKNKILFKKFRIFYTRYADDFVILTNQDITVCENIREKIKNFLIEKLKLELSIEKTKITNLKSEHAKFLGFSIFISNRPPVKVENSKKSKDSFLKICPQIPLIGIDQIKVFDRLVEKGFAKKKYS